MTTPRGVIIINTGDGKGKTTAALGVLLRARGHNLRVAMLQFFKSPGRPYGWIDMYEVILALRGRPPAMHVVLTGCNAPEALIEAADLVTEMRLLKHPYREQGVAAQAGIEW